MRVPQNNSLDFCRELIETCEASRKGRISQGAMWRKWFYLGSGEDLPAVYNKMYPHVLEVASYLYSPGDLRFSIDFERTKGKEFLDQGQAASNILSREFARAGCDMTFNQANEGGLIKGCNVIKTTWGDAGLSPHLIQPERLAVFREDISDLNAQEVIVETNWYTPSLLRAMLWGRSDLESLMAEIEAKGSVGTDDPSRDDLFKQIMMGGTMPVATSPTNNPAGGIVLWMSGPNPDLPSKVLASLIRVDEIWVKDTERQDYTTFQVAGNAVMIEGHNRHANLCGVKGQQPYRIVGANVVDGYQWGRSEIATLMILQDRINTRMAGTEMMLRRQEDPNYLGVGITDQGDEKKNALRGFGNLIAETEPNAKLEAIAQELPDKLWEAIHEYIAMFQDVSGIKSIQQGRGEPGVRAGVHADTLLRTASSRLKNRALVVERQLGDFADFCLRLLMAHDATIYQTKADPSVIGRLMGQKGKGADFYLAQLPDDFRVTVDSHSSSPAFVMDAENLAMALARMGAIGPVDLLRLTPIQHKDMLIASAEAREEAQAALVQAHPELLSKGTGKKGR